MNIKSIMGSSMAFSWFFSTCFMGCSIMFLHFHGFFMFYSCFFYGFLLHSKIIQVALPRDQPATDTRRTRRSFCTKAFAPKSAAEEEREEEPKEGDEGGELWVNDHKFTGIMVYHD